MQSNQPAITPAQIAAAVVALIAPTAALLAAFGVYTLTGEQQDALSKMIFALAGLAAVIVAADAHLRAARNRAHAVIEAAKPADPVDPVPASLPPVAVKPAAVRSHKKKV